MTASTFFIVHTEPNGERRAYDHLTEQGCDVYFPIVQVTRRRSRRQDAIVRPFFPRYMFVRDDGRGVAFIQQSRGVVDIVRHGSQPARVPIRLINSLMRREDEDGFIQLTERSAGIFQRMRGDTRALIFLSGLFSGATEIKQVECVG